MAAKKTRIKRNRPSLSTKDELLSYLASHPETEYPFIQELWDKSVEMANKDIQNGRKSKIIEVVDANGNKVQKKKQVGFWSDNPVTHYFKLSGLPCWVSKGKQLLDGNALPTQPTEHQQQIMNTYFDDSTETSFSDELISWIDMFDLRDRQYLQKRYTHYYDAYDINEGADKTFLKEILSLEIALHRVDIRRACNQGIDVQEEKRLRDMLSSIMENLKWTKKQRNAREELAQNKFTVWMDTLAKEGEFNPPQKEYPKDEIDFLLETYIDSASKMLS